MEVIMTVAILAMAVWCLYSLFNVALKMVWETKARIGATQLANQKLEIARNLPYGEVGTTGGVVSGSIPENETVVLNEIDYDVYTNVTYVDDPFDGTYNSDPVDPLTNDYKRILVRVSWDSEFSSSPVEFYTDVAPKNGEEDLGGGTLAITVFDAGGRPVENAEVQIKNDTLTPAIQMHTYTNAQGQLLLPGVAAAEDSYQIVVTKAGYSTDQTYAASQELTAPDKPFLTIWEGRTTADSYSIDQTADLTIQTQDVNGVALEGVAVQLRGNKIIGHDGSGNNVYKYNQTLTSSGVGNIILPGREWDNYTLAMPEASNYNIAATMPIQPIGLVPGVGQTVTVVLEPKAAHSLLVIVRDVDGLAIDGATVKVKNGTSYNKTLTTGIAGQAFFTPLENATTTVEVEHGSYQRYSDEFVLSGYTTDPVILVK